VTTTSLLPVVTVATPDRLNFAFPPTDSAVPLGLDATPRSPTPVVVRPYTPAPAGLTPRTPTDWLLTVHSP
jgi:hypothetical protein